MGSRTCDIPGIGQFVLAYGARYGYGFVEQYRKIIGDHAIAAMHIGTCEGDGLSRDRTCEGSAVEGVGKSILDNSITNCLASGLEDGEMHHDRTVTALSVTIGETMIFVTTSCVSGTEPGVVVAFANIDMPHRGVVDMEVHREDAIHAMVSSQGDRSGSGIGETMSVPGEGQSGSTYGAVYCVGDISIDSKAIGDDTVATSAVGDGNNRSCCIIIKGYIIKNARKVVFNHPFVDD